jgi:hypothetical protein
MQQATTVPTAPQAPQSPRATAGEAVPTTRAELDALVAKRGELQNQLQQLTDRRRDLVQQHNNTTAEGGRAIDARMAVIDDRSGRIESEIFQADEAIASAMARGVTIGGGGGGGGGPRASTMIVDDRVIRAIRNEVSDSIGQSVAATVFGSFVAYLIWRGVRRFFRKKQPVVTAPPDNTDRLTHLQQSMDVIAIEVERISEAQRYMSRVVSENLLPAGAAQPVSMHDRSPARLRPDDKG